MRRSFDTERAVFEAYLTVAHRLPQLLVPLARWSAAGFISVAGTFYLTAFLILRNPQTASPLLYLFEYAEIVVYLAASVSLSVAWYRWIILGEQEIPILPRARNVAMFAGPHALVFLVPFLTAPYALDALLGTWGESIDSFWYDNLTYGVAVLVPTAAARYMLILAARATDDDLSLREAWRLTEGNWWPLFWGVAACRLPLAVATVWLTDTAWAFGFGTPAYAALYCLGSLAELFADIVSAAFIAYAYLHFTHDRPNMHRPERHFA